MENFQLCSIAKCHYRALIALNLKSTRLIWQIISRGEDQSANLVSCFKVFYVYISSRIFSLSWISSVSQERIPFLWQLISALFVLDHRCDASRVNLVRADRKFGTKNREGNEIVTHLTTLVTAWLDQVLADCCILISDEGAAKYSWSACIWSLYRTVFILCVCVREEKWCWKEFLGCTDIQLTLQRPKTQMKNKRGMKTRGAFKL